MLGNKVVRLMVMSIFQTGLFGRTYIWSFLWSLVWTVFWEGHK